MLTWVVLRAAGIAAYLMLWATVTWGLIGTTALVGKRVARATAITITNSLPTQHSFCSECTSGASSWTATCISP